MNAPGCFLSLEEKTLKYTLIETDFVFLFLSMTRGNNMLSTRIPFNPIRSWLWFQCLRVSMTWPALVWFMTYNNCDYIKNLYKNYTIIETSWSYGMNATKESSEIVIINNV